MSPLAVSQARILHPRWVCRTFTPYLTMSYRQSLTIIRGVPGSGKSTLAAQLKYGADIAGEPCHIVEMDDYRTDSAGNYSYDPQHNREIAGKCFNRTVELIQANQSVIVANIFLKQPQLKSYKLLAKKHNVLYLEYICNSDLLSIHGVSYAEANAMRKRLELCE